MAQDPNLSFLPKPPNPGSELPSAFHLPLPKRALNLHQSPKPLKPPQKTLHKNPRALKPETQHPKPPTLNPQPATLNPNALNTTARLPPGCEGRRTLEKRLLVLLDLNAWLFISGFRGLGVRAFGFGFRGLGVWALAALGFWVWGFRVL